MSRRGFNEDSDTEESVESRNNNGMGTMDGIVVPDINQQQGRYYRPHYADNGYENQRQLNTNQGSLQVSQQREGTDIDSVRVSVSMRNLEKICMGGQSFFGDYDEGSGIMVRRQVRSKVWSTVKFLPSSLLENISGLYEKINETDNILSVILSATNEVKYLNKEVNKLQIDVVFKLWKLYYHDVQKELSGLRCNQNKSLKTAMMNGMMIYVILLLC